MQRTLELDGSDDLDGQDQRHVLARPLRQWELRLPQPAYEALSGPG